MVSFRLSSSPPSCRRGRILKVESSMRGRSHEATSTSTSLIYEDSRETTPSMYPGEEQLSSSSHNDFKCITSSSSSGCTYTRDSDEDLCRKHLLLHGKPTFHAKACQERSSSLASTFHFFPSSFLFSSSLGTSKMKSSSFSCTLFVFSSIFFLLFFLFSSSSSSSSSLSSIFLPSSLVILISKQHSLFPSSSLPSFLLASASSPPSASIEEQLEEKYTPRNCKYRPLPKNLNEFAYLSYNGEITIGDVFGLPASSIHHEQRISFSLSSSPSSSSSQRRAILSVSVEMHRDNVTEFNHLELYKRKKGEKPHPSLSAAEAASAADGMGAMQSALRKQQALAIGKRVEGAGGPRTKVVLSSALSDEAGDLVFDLVFSFRDSFGRTAVGEGEESNIYSPLLPCFPVRLDLSLVPVDRMPLHIPANCPEESSLPSQNGLTQKLGDASFTSSNSPEMPYVFVFRNLAPWSPYSLAVWHTTIEVPRRLHRFARLFFRLSFRFLSGPLQLVLELFDEKALPDATATRPQCLLGCMGGTPTYNGQLFDHAMPTGFTYKIWILAGEPMFLEDHSTQCIQFDFEYKVDYEARLTPFEVGSHSWNCKFARLPGEIHQIDESMVVLSSKEGGVGSSPGKKEEGVGAVHARSLDLKDWFGFPPDEVDEMIHFINLHIKEVSDVRLSLFETRLRLRTALTTGGTPENVDSMRAVCDEKTFGGDSSGMVELHCRVSPGEYRLALYAEYPLGGLPPCDGFYMHLTIKPVSLLNERYSCRYRDNGMNGGLSYPPLLISPSTPPPLAIPQPSDTVIDLGPLELGKEEENFRVFMYKLTPPPSGVESSFISIARSRFSVQKSLTQVYVHIAVLSDFAAVDVSAIIRKEGENAEDSPDKTGNYYPLSFSSSYQHLVGPLDAGEYVAELLALSPQTIDQNAANAVHELCVPFSIDLRLVGRGGDNLHSSTWLCNHETPHLPRYIRGEAGVEMTLDKQFLLPSGGYHYLHVYIPRQSILKLHVNASHGNLTSEPRLTIYPKDRPQEKLAEAYTDLFLEADIEGEYIIRMNFSFPSGGSIPPCSKVQLHLVLLPKVSLPTCPWSASHY